MKPPWVIALASALAVVAAAPWAWATWRVVGPHQVYVTDAVIGLVVPFAGAFLLGRRPGHPVGLVLLSTAGLGVAFLGLSWSTYAVLVEPGALPGPAWAGWVAGVTWQPFLALVTLLPLWFPDGRLPGRWWRAVEVLVLVELATLVVLCAIEPRDTLGLLPNPLFTGPEWAAEVRGALTAATVFTGVLLCLPAVLVRYLRADGDGRSVLRWYVLATVLAAVCLVVPLPVPYGEVLTAAGLLLLTLAITVAVLRHRLYGIDVAVRRALVYATTGLISALLYAAVVALADRVLPEGAALLGAAAVAVVFAPLRERVQILARRLLYGDGDDPYLALTRLGARLAEPLDPAELPGAAVAEVRRALRVPYVALARSGVPAAESGRRTGTVEEIPLGRADILWVTPRDGGLSERDRALLAELARPLAAALERHDLAAELHAARERVVAALEEERERVHRDLHDGIGPTLAALVLGLDAVAAAARAGRPVDRPLAEVKAGLRTAVAELRHVVDAVRPQTLDDLGLVPAVRRHLSSLPGTARMRLHADPLGPLPPEVELAAYRIVTEAVTNVVRHAAALSCDVELRRDGATLLLRVVDDGVGIPDPAPDGVGLRSARDRAAALGGRCRVEWAPGGGTVLVAEFPVPNRDAPPPALPERTDPRATTRTSEAP